MVIGIEFRGGCVYPKNPSMSVGGDLIINKLLDFGHVIIILCENGSSEISKVLSWSKKNNVAIDGINSELIFGSTCDYIISPNAIGTPIITTLENEDIIDWEKLENILSNRDLL